jgi:transposase
MSCSETEVIRSFFAELGPFHAVIEATSSYEWLWQLLEPLADRLVLAHPSKLRIIAESTKKSDKLDAQVLAEFLALDMIPPAHRPTPRQRAYRRLVRQRLFLQDQRKAVRCRMRALLADYNADDPKLFTGKGLARLAKLALDNQDRFVMEQLEVTWHSLSEQIHAVEEQLRSFAETAPAKEMEARAVLASMPQVGPVTIDVVVSELGDISRFRSAKQVCAYAGLVPGQRESAGKRKDLGITKQGSPRLRWALIEAAWRMVMHTNRWRAEYDRLKAKRGSKRAITAIARRLLCVMTALLRKGQAYRMAA